MDWSQFGTIEPKAPPASDAPAASPWEKFGTIEKNEAAAPAPKGEGKIEDTVAKMIGFSGPIGVIASTVRAARDVVMGKNEFDYPEFSPSTPVREKQNRGVLDAIKDNPSMLLPMGHLQAPIVAADEMAKRTGALGKDAVMARGEEGLLDVIRKANPNFRTQKDKFGNDIIDINGSKYYLNKAGISARDLSEVYRDTLITLPFSFGAAGATAGAGLLMRMGAQGAAGAIGSLGTDLESKVAGSDQGVDFGALVFSALGGAAGEAAGSLISSIANRVKTNPSRFIDPNSGQLTQEGERIFAEAGFDPSEISQQIAARFAQRARQTGPVPATARQVAAEEFRIPLTRGQATGDFDQIAFEQAAQRGARGETAGTIMRGRIDLQNEAITTARNQIADDLAMPPAGRTGFVAATRDPQDAAGIVLDSIRAAERTSAQGVDDAYRAVRSVDQNVSVRPEALPDLQNSVRNALTDAEVDFRLLNPANKSSAQNYPAASQAMNIIDEMTRITPRAPDAHADTVLDDFFKRNPKWRPVAEAVADEVPEVDLTLRAIEGLRKSIGGASGLINTAGNNADRRVVRAILRGVDEWIGNLSDDMLMRGEGVEQAVEMLRAARAQAAQHFNRFGERTLRSGTDDAGKVIERMIGGEVTQNEVANFLFGSSLIGDSGRAIRVLRRVKEIVGTDGVEWAAIRRAMWQRITQNTEGKDAFGAQAIANNIAGFVNGKGRQMAELLFSDAERQQMRRFAAVLRSTVPPRGATNPSGTGYEIGRMISQAIGETPIIRIFAHIRSAKDTLRAARASGAPRARTLAPLAFPLAGSITGGTSGGE